MAGVLPTRSVPVLPEIKTRISMLCIDNNGVIETGHLQNLRIEIRIIRVVKRYVETLLRLERRHEIAVREISTCSQLN